MPAPTEAGLEKIMRSAFVASGLTVKTLNSFGDPEDTGKLSAETEKLIRAISLAISNQWVLYNAQAVVSIPVTSAPGTPSVGILV